MPISLPQLFAGLIFAVWIAVGLDAFVETWLAAMRQPPLRAVQPVAVAAAVAAPRQEEPLPAPASVPAVADVAEPAAAGPATPPSPTPPAAPVGGTGAEPAPASPQLQELALRLNKSDAKRGSAAAASCNRCHGVGKAVAPPLDGVVGRDIGSVPGYGYSVTLQTLEGLWLHEWLDQFLADPEAFAPGSRHDFAGLADAGERADIIAFLRSISPRAPALPIPMLAPQTDAPH